MNDKNYKYDGTDIFPNKIKTSNGYILTKVNNGLYDNSFLPEYMNERGDISVIPDVEKYKIVEENEYMFYVYDFLIGQHILTIDTARNRTRLDRLNIYGQCYSFGDKWEKVTKATINRALRRDGYDFDDYIKEHYPDFNYPKTSTIKYFTKLKKEFYYSHNGFLSLEHKLWSCTS